MRRLWPAGAPAGVRAAVLGAAAAHPRRTRVPGARTQRGARRGIPVSGRRADRGHRPALRPCARLSRCFSRRSASPRRVDHVPARVKIAQSCVGALGVWLIAALAGRAGGPRAGVAAAAVAAVYPPLVWMPAYALSETLFSTLALAAAWALTLTDGRRLPAAAPESVSVPVSAAALITGAAILVRPTMILFVPLGALWLIRRAGLTYAALFVALAALCVTPWTLRNHRVYGRWIPVASEGGVTFWTGNHRAGHRRRRPRREPVVEAGGDRVPGGTSRPDARRAGTFVLPGRARLDRQASGRLADPARPEGVLYRRAGRSLLCATLGEVPGRVDRVVRAGPGCGASRASGGGMRRPNGTRRAGPAPRLSG